MKPDRDYYLVNGIEDGGYVIYDPIDKEVYYADTKRIAENFTTNRARPHHHKFIIKKLKGVSDNKIPEFMYEQMLWNYLSEVADIAVTPMEEDMVYSTSWEGVQSENFSELMRLIKAIKFNSAEGKIVLSALSEYEEFLHELDNDFLVHTSFDDISLINKKAYVNYCIYEYNK